MAKAQGKGIFLFNKLNQISNWKKEYKGWNVLQKEEKKDTEAAPPVEQYLVQQYVAAPYLIGGKKFDLRIYALVTSYYPLKVYLHRSGFARFSNHRYTTNISDMSNNCNPILFLTFCRCTSHKRSDSKNLRKLQSFWL